MTVGLKKFSDYNTLAGYALRGDETVLLADTASTGSITASTISATASTNTINDSGGGLPIFKPGALALISGFTDTGGELNALHTVVSSTVNDLVVATDITVDEAAGQSVTVSEVAAMYQVPLSALAASPLNYPPVEAVSSAARSVSVLDCGKYLQCTNVAGCEVTVPPQSDVAWPDFAEIHGRSTQNSTTFVAGTGVTIAVPAGFTLEAGNGAAWTLKREAQDQWVLIGALVGAP